MKQDVKPWRSAWLMMGTIASRTPATEAPARGLKSNDKPKFNLGMAMSYERCFQGSMLRSMASNSQKETVPSAAIVTRPTYMSSIARVCHARQIR
ncbi:hypothetical protein D3C81_1637490 [compost metagenome]